MKSIVAYVPCTLTARSSLTKLSGINIKLLQENVFKAAVDSLFNNVGEKLQITLLKLTVHVGSFILERIGLVGSHFSEIHETVWHCSDSSC